MEEIVRPGRPQEEWGGGADKDSGCCMYLVNSGKPYPTSEQLPQLHPRTTHCGSVPCQLCKAICPFLGFRQQQSNGRSLMGMECAGLWSRRNQGQGVAKGSNSQSCFFVFIFLMGTWEALHIKKRSQCGSETPEATSLCGDICCLV